MVRDRQELAEIVRRSTQVHLCTDNEQSKHVVNEETVKNGGTLIFAGVFDGGCGGEVERVAKGGACYACSATYLNRSGRFDDQQAPETFDYTNPNGPEKSTAALNLDIAQIALIQARVGLLTMLTRNGLGADLDGNYILFGNRPVEGLFPKMLCSDVWNIPRDAGCLVCGTAGMSETEVDAAAEDILAKADCQTH